MNIIKSISAVALCALAFTSCHNSDWEFDDYGTTTAYFAVAQVINNLVSENFTTAAYDSTKTLASSTNDEYPTAKCEVCDIAEKIISVENTLANDLKIYL